MLAQGPKSWTDVFRCWHGSLPFCCEATNLRKLVREVLCMQVLYLLRPTYLHDTAAALCSTKHVSLSIVKGVKSTFHSALQAGGCSLINTTDRLFLPRYVCVSNERRRGCVKRREACVQTKRGVCVYLCCVLSPVSSERQRPPFDILCSKCRRISRGLSHRREHGQVRTFC